MGLECGLVQKSGSWYTYGQTRLGQGRENSRTLLENSRELADELEKAIREKSMGGEVESKDATVANEAEPAAAAEE